MPQQLQLSDFELGDTLGVGTVGTIYRATMRDSGQDVALKILLPSVSDDPLIKARFRREMSILEKISHPNIVKYFGGGRDGQQLFYAMEYVDGGSLKEVLHSQGPLTWREAASFGAQVCSALQHLHNHGIIHRDLKPGNLFFTLKGVLKLGDFGIARDTNAADLTADRLTVGTYAYMSPEQIRGDRDVTGTIDLYALGCLLFEALTARPPFVGDNFAQLFDQHLNSQPPAVRTLAPDCPADFEQLLMELMDKDPQKRPFNARAVQGRLLRMLESADELALADSKQGSDDVAAAAVDSAQQLLAHRLERLPSRRARQEVSWLALGLLLAAVVAVVIVAWQFSG